MLSPTGLLPSLVSEFHCSSASVWLCNFRPVRHNREVMSYNPQQTTRVRLHLLGLG